MFRAIKVIAYGFWNLMMLIFMLMTISCQVVWWMMVTLPVKVYQHFKTGGAS